MLLAKVPNAEMAASVAINRQLVKLHPEVTVGTIRPLEGT